MPGAVMGPLLDEKAEALFDPTKVLYLGTANNGTRICVSRKDSKIKTFDDALTQKAKFGGVSANDSTREYGYLHKRTAGASTTWSRVTPALPRSRSRSSVARSTASAAGIGRASSRSGRTGCRDDKVNVLLQVGLEPNDELTRMGVPSVFKYVKNEDDRKVVELVISQQVFQRSYIAPPGLPAEQLAHAARPLSTPPWATSSSSRTPKRLRLDISPLSGTKVQDLVQKLYATPKDVIVRARQAITP